MNLKNNAIRILLEDIKSSLGMEHTEVMSMEGIEINLCNSKICGVSVEVENQGSDALKKDATTLGWR